MKTRVTLKFFVSCCWLLWITFAFSSTAKATTLSGHFYPQVFFTLNSFPNIFDITLLLSKPPWEPEVLPRSFQGFMLILKTQAWPNCLFDSQQLTIFIFRRIRF